MSSKTPENTRTTRRSNSAADSSKRKGTAGSSSSAKSPVRPKASDPFDFISKASIHPEPLKDISIEKTAFGGVKFSKTSPPDADRYKNIEKIAERRLNQSGIDTSQKQKSSSRPDTLTSLNTSSSSFNLDVVSTTTTPKSRKGQGTGNTSLMSTSGQKTPGTQKSEPKKLGRKRTTTDSSNDSVSPTKRTRADKAFDKNLPSATKSDDHNYVLPTLTAEEQMDVDNPNDQHRLLSAGARVLALWGADYYAAYVCGRDGLGRYYVLFAEDNLKRIIPPTGVIPISLLIPGSIVSFISQVNGDEMGKVAEIVTQPSSDDHNLWKEGLFEMSTDDKKPNEKVVWSKIYLTKEQGNAFQLKKLDISSIEQENVVNESRSSRRTRSQYAESSTISPAITVAPTKSPTTRTPRGQKTLELKTETVLQEESKVNTPEKEPKASNNGVAPETQQSMTSTESPVKSKSPKNSPTKININGSVKAPDVIPSSIDTVSEIDESRVFQGLKFLLTSAPRANKKTDFNKRDYRQKIVDRGGEIIDDFSNLNDNDKAFLIADTYYRTHKYLFALSLSVPCVSQKWILECVEKKQLADYQPYLLPAGESSLSSGEISEWKSLKGKLLRGKIVMVYSNAPPAEEENVVSFVNIWSPMIKNLGANLVDPLSPEMPLSEKIASFQKSKIDIMLTDSECEKPLADGIESVGGLVVSSEYIIQGIIMGELPDVSSCDRFRYSEQ